MLIMGLLSWILSLLVVCAAFPLAKRGDVKESENSDAFSMGENKEIKVDKLPDSKNSRDNQEAVTKTNLHEELHKGEVLAIINRFNNSTGKIHTKMRQMYHWYMQGNKSTNSINALSVVRNNLVKYFPRMYVSNKTFHINNNVSTNRNQSGVKVTTQRHKSEVIINVPAQEDDRKKKEHSSQEGNHDILKSKKDENLAKSTHKTVSVLNSDEVSSTLVEESVNESPVTSCQHVPGFDAPRFLQMIVTCSQHWTELDIKSKCESWENINTMNFWDEVLFLPVQDENGSVFANVYCAVCHNVSFYLPWTTSFVCNNASIEPFQLLDFTNLTPLCSHIITSKCERRIFPAISESVKECDQGAVAVANYIRKNDEYTTETLPSNYPTSFNVLMNFDFTGQTHILFTASQTVIQMEYIPRCHDGQIYDPYIENCRQITCNWFYTLVGNKCVLNGSGPTANDGITDFSQLRTVNVITLQVNITFHDYLIMKFKDSEQDIILQIAGQLNISIDRMKDVNITYELGSIKGSALQITTLTEEEYKKMLPFNHSQHLTNTGSRGWEEDGFTKEWTSVLQKLTSTDSGIDNITMSHNNDTLETEMITRDETKIKSLIGKFRPQITSYEDVTTSSRKAHMVGEDSNLPTNSTPPIKGKTKEPHILRDNETLLDELRTNANTRDMILDKKLFSYYGHLVKTHFGFFRYHLKSQDDGADLYLSAPINDQNDRISLLVRDKRSLKQLLQHSMAMRVSFALVSPSDPLSNEEGSSTLLQKIDSLIYQQRFSLKINGNEVDVVSVDDDRNRTMIDNMDFCPLGVEYIVFDDEFLMVTVGNSTLLYVNKTNSYIGVGLFDLFIMFSGSNNADETNVTGVMKYAYVCCMPRIIEDCNRINLEKREYYYAGENKSIIFEGKEYDIFQYRILDEKTGSIQICVPPTFSNNDETILPHIVVVDNGCSSDFDETLRAEGYMTLVLGRVSICAHCFVILTYIILPALRNLPGLNLMSLTLCLLVTQVIFAEGIGADRSWLCKTVAVSLHYTLLAAHFWMNVISYDVYKTFTSSITLTHAQKKAKYFPRYALYAFGMPLIIVSICVIVDFSSLFHGVSIGYGSAVASSTDLSQSCHNCTIILQDSMENNISLITGSNNIHSCWITHPLAALVAFGDFILIFFLVNCIFFAKTIFSISKTTKMARDNLSTRSSNGSSRKISDHSEVMLYLRMSTVMGFTWVFGLTSSIMSSFIKSPTYTACAVIHLVVILFIIFNTSQGFFIFVAFVCNRRVLGLYKECIQRVLKQKQIGKLFTTSSSRSVLSHNN